MADRASGSPPRERTERLGWTDWALGLMADLPLAPIEKLSTLLLLNGYARNEASLARGLDAARAAEGRSPEDEDGDTFLLDDGLQRILDGLEALVTSRV